MADETVPLAVLTGPTRKPRSLWSDARRRLLANAVARLGIAIIVIFALMAILPPIIWPYNARLDSDLSLRLKPPSMEHLMGTDTQGRDVLRRVVHGARVSLGVGISAVAVAVIAGTLIGLISGFIGAWLDITSMFLMDILLAFPSTLLAIAIVSMRGPGLFNSLIAVSIVNIPVYARIARSTVLSVKRREYITAAQAVGSPGMRILFRHILPNSLPAVVVQATLGVAVSVIEIAALGFLGLGAQPPTPEWGAMLADSYKYLTSGSWWVLVFPGLAIMLTVLGFNLFGDGLRDALDPQLR